VRDRGRAPGPDTAEPLTARRSSATALLALLALLSSGACAGDGAGDTDGDPAITSDSGAGTAALEPVDTVRLIVRRDPGLGEYLAVHDGRPLYVFTVDSADGTQCTGACAERWQPLLVRATTRLHAPSVAQSALGTVSRTRDLVQVTVRGAPLYVPPDTALGLASQGRREFGGIWRGVAPDGRVIPGGR
jgi:predicted lipoprotein with Yx(FWY)xxD motif